MHAMTAAHKTMPLPATPWCATRRTAAGGGARQRPQGRSTDGRVIDLNHAAARKLGISGIAKVEVRRPDACEIRSGSWKLPAQRAWPNGVAPDRRPRFMAHPSVPRPRPWQKASCSRSRNAVDRQHDVVGFDERSDGRGGSTAPAE